MSPVIKFSHICTKGPVIIYQLGGGGRGGLGNFRWSWKKFYPNGGVKISFMNPWGGGHKYDFHFLFWNQNALASAGLRPQTPSPIINFLNLLKCPTFHHHHRKMKTWRDMHMLRCPQSDSWSLYGKYFNKLWIFCWREWNARMEPTLGQSFSTAYVTRDEWTALTRIVFAEKHHKFLCMYVLESS